MEQNQMRNISVIGLGNMGSSLAKALVQGGHDVTIWNRADQNVENAAPLVQAGARLAEDLRAAIKASDIIIVCILDYASTFSLFDPADTSSALAGKVFVQLSSGTPQEARDSAAWAKEHGAVYLDGVLLNTPSEVGTPEFAHIYAGDQSAFEGIQDALKNLGGNPFYVGENPSNAAALDVGFLSFLFTAWAGFIHGAAVCLGEGVSIEDYSKMVIPTVDNLIAPHLSVMAEMISNNKFPGDVAKLDAYLASTEHIVQVCKETGVNSSIPAALHDIVNAAVKAGHGGDDYAAIFPVLRGGLGREN